MARARLLSIDLENFKCFKSSGPIEFSPLTIILGRNNSGKSTLIQSLLLLKQTLADPRSNVPLKLEGTLDATSLRELTHGWPSAEEKINGPILKYKWNCEIDVAAARQKANNPDLQNLATHSGTPWLRKPPPEMEITTSISIKTIEQYGSALISEIILESHHIDSKTKVTTLKLIRDNNEWRSYWNNEKISKIEIEFDHFIPYLKINKSLIGPRNRERSWHNAYLFLFEQPLESFKEILNNLHYLGSTRQPPPSLYKATAAPAELGISGEFAANLLHRRQNDIVHYLSPQETSLLPLQYSETINSLPLVESVNEVMKALSIDSPIKIQEIQDIGFRILFGEASLSHVGRGLSYLLPIVELGLYADPMRFEPLPPNTLIKDYNLRCKSFTHVALEEPEAHLHPKVASRLAHWLVCLAMTNRRMIVETHSDHLVRRLRGLAARAGTGSDIESWLIKNVKILIVEHDGDKTIVTPTGLKSDGSVGEIWPEDFMDESTNEESAIYYAGISKTNTEKSPDQLIFKDEDEPESDEAP